MKKNHPPAAHSLKRMALPLLAALTLCSSNILTSAQSWDLDPKARHEFIKKNEEIGKLVQKAKKQADSRKFEKAIQSQTAAVNKSIGVYRPHERTFVELMRTLAHYNDSANKPLESLRIRQQVFDNVKDSLPELDPYRLELLYDLAIARHDNGEDSLAIPLIESVLKKAINQRVAEDIFAAKAYRIYADHVAASADTIAAPLFAKKAEAAMFRATHDSINTHALNDRACDAFYDSADLFRFGRKEEAVDSMNSAIAQWNLYDGPFSLNVGNAKKALSFYAINMKDYPKAIRNMRESLFIYDYLGQNDDFEFSKTMSQLSTMYYFSRDSEGTSQSVKETFESFKKLISKNFSTLSSQERADFWDRCQYYFEKTLPSFALYVPSLTSTCYDAVLLSKGLLLNADTELRQTILNSNDPSLKNKMQTVRLLRRSIEEQLYLPAGSRDASLIESARKTAQKLEKELTETCDKNGNFTRNLSTSWQDVQARLKPGEAAIEFQYIPIGGWDSHGYSALILKPEYDAPMQQFLCMEEDIDKLLSEGTDFYSTSELSELIWEPLSKYIDNCSTVYFAPAGMFYSVAIESLPSPNGTGFVADNTDFYRLSSTRELVKKKAERRPIKSAAVYGGLFYSPQQEALFNATPEEADSLQLTFSVDGMSYLPATRTEADTISNLLKADGNRKVYSYTGSIGSESSFKNLSGKEINLIHVATHGHYYDLEEAIYHKDLRFIDAAMTNVDAISAEDRMMSRSGLYFAGANTYSRNASNPGIIDDGILTAKEISELDFRGLDLVVLSACETGLGDVTGDGVYGLQRGFKKAGANSILMSLWKIDDDATSILMTRFYQYLSEGLGKYASLKKAQSDLRGLVDHNGDKPYASPDYWGGFVILDALD